jgi:glycosyltransferase involved in cell wall biosynthesis
MKPPSISVIIPTLNEEKYIGGLLDSLNKQTFKEFEIIIIDGFSTDKTCDIIRSRKKNLKLQLKVVKKRGAGRQRNVGASKAEHDHFVFLDADVILREDFFENLAKWISNENVCLATCHFVMDSDNLFDKIFFGLYNLVYLDLLTRFFPGSGGAFLYVRKDVFDSVSGFDEDVVLGEDFDLVRRLSKLDCRLHVFRNLKIYISARRLEKEGRVKFAKKMIKAAIYFQTKGPIKDPKLFKHEFGDY